MKTITTLKEAFERVRENGWYLKFVPKDLRTPELCMMAVKEHEGALRDVPEALRTPELCMMAVKEHGGALRHVPENLKTIELCKIAVEQCGSALDDVPEGLKTPELYKFAVEKSGWALRFVPEALKTPELCKIAVENYGRALQYVPNQKSFLTTYPEYLPQYFKQTLKKDQDPDIISLLIQTTNNNIIDEIGYKINLYKIRKKDLPFIVGCQNKAITDFLNKKFKTKGT